MKNKGCSDLWDIIIEKYCNKEEKRILSHISEEDYMSLDSDFDALLEHISIKIKLHGSEE